MLKPLILRFCGEGLNLYIGVIAGIQLELINIKFGDCLVAWCEGPLISGKPKVPHISPQ